MLFSKIAKRSYFWFFGLEQSLRYHFIDKQTLLQSYKRFFFPFFISSTQKYHQPPPISFHHIIFFVYFPKAFIETLFTPDRCCYCCCCWLRRGRIKNHWRNHEAWQFSSPFVSLLREWGEKNNIYFRLIKRQRK